MKRKIRKREISGRARPGCFYAVGIGPGASDLLTLRAVRLIKTADVILAPRSETSQESLALKTISGLLKDQKVIEHSYPMTSNAGRTSRCWRAAAKMVARECRAGKAVVQVTVGDPLIYSTSVYLIEHLQKMLPAARIRFVSGITAFQAMAARLGEALTIQDDRLMLLPATDLPAVDRAFKQCETLVLYKVGHRLPQLISLLRRRRLLSKARLAGRVEQPGREIVLPNLMLGNFKAVGRGVPGLLRRSKAFGYEGWTEPSENNLLTGYMSTVIVHIGRRKWRNVKPSVMQIFKERKI